MSLVSLQEAVALLIRRPEFFSGQKVDETLKGFELDDKERQQITNLARERQVVKFGKKLRRFRLSDTIEALPFLEDFLPFSFLKKIWENLFEPNAVKISNWDLPFEFLNFITTDAEARDAIRQQGPDFILDYIDYCFALEKIESTDLRSTPLPEFSLLRHSGLLLVSLRYNIPLLLDIIAKSDNFYDFSAFKPASEPLYMALVQLDDNSFKVFQIDIELKRFFEKQLYGSKPTTVLPQNYADLVALGLCT